MREAAYAISDTIDSKIASLYSDAASANKLGSDGASAKTIGYGSGELDPYKTLINMGVLLSNANVPHGRALGGCAAVVCGHVAQVLELRRQPCRRDRAEHGQRLRCAGCRASTCTRATTSPTTRRAQRPGASCWAHVTGDQPGSAEAAGMEAIRLQDRFSDGVRGLLLYGVKVVRPATLAVLFAKEGADA